MLGKFQSPWTSEMEPLLPALSVSASPSQRLKPTVLSLEPGILPYSVPTCCRGVGTHAFSLTVKGTPHVLVQIPSTALPCVEKAHFCLIGV